MDYLFGHPTSRKEFLTLKKGVIFADIFNVYQLFSESYKYTGAILVAAETAEEATKIIQEAIKNLQWKKDRILYEGFCPVKETQKHSCLKSNNKGIVFNNIYLKDEYY